jgi:hypothetical protein
MGNPVLIELPSNRWRDASLYSVDATIVVVLLCRWAFLKLCYPPGSEMTAPGVPSTAERGPEGVRDRAL